MLSRPALPPHRSAHRRVFPTSIGFGLLLSAAGVSTGAAAEGGGSDPDPAIPACATPTFVIDDIPGAAGPRGLKFITDHTVWTGDGELAVSGRAQPARLTYSFPADGTVWGLRPPFSANDLNARLIEAYGDLDLGRELIRQALASWERITGVEYDEVADDNSPADHRVERDPGRGDVRIGGQDLGGAVLAYNAFPARPPAEGGSGSDMVINTALFESLFVGDPETTFRFFRHTVAHENGHGLGFFHVAPCTGTKIMEPTIPSGGLEPLAVDETRGGGRNYGDRHAGNRSQAEAFDLGDLHHQGGSILEPSLLAPRSVIERQLSTNGADGPEGTDNDWYRFALSRGSTLTISAEPVGGTYDAAEVGPDCTMVCNAQTRGAGAMSGGPCPPIEASSAGDLALELYSTKGLLVAVDSAGPGLPEVLTTPLQRGDYWLRIVDVGPNPGVNQLLQLYDLSLLTSPPLQPQLTVPAPPTAFAGLDKRCAIGGGCYFIGDLGSYANDPTATGPLSFDWDLDGDGVFELLGDPRPATAYRSPGVRTVSLRVTDSNGRKGTDSLALTVYEPQGRCCFFGVSPEILCDDMIEAQCRHLEGGTWTAATTCGVPCEGGGPAS